ncbi:MAG: hypothetical protein ACI8XO_004327 [Verrucomicrobiales bacterium]|jgi:hypothetical protein
MKLPTHVLALFALTIYSAPADEDSKSTEKLIFKTEWKGERITLPPPFAKDMKLQGIEEIRFAPGMFKPDSDSFFSYVFVFSVPGEKKLSEKVIKSETLTYYRGLAKSVLAGRGKEVDPSKFKFELEKAKQAKGVPASVADAKSVVQYTGKLDWIEPFATAKPQVLHFEIQAWADPKTKRNYLFVGTSPKEIDDKAEIWKKLRKIRSDFKVEAVESFSK